MKEVITLIVVLILIITTIVLSILVYKVYVKINKIHSITSVNSIELEQINKLAIGKDSPFCKIEQKINGMHTVISTHLVKGILKNKEEE